MSIVITGSPGVGKHTVTNEIKNCINLPVLDINDFAREHGLLEKNNDSYDVDTKKLSKKLQEKITSPHIIVGHLAPYSISSIPIKVAVVLRRNPEELAKVYKNRRYTEKKTKDNLGSEVLGIIVNAAQKNIGIEKIIQVDVTGKDISETKRIVLDAINGNQKSHKVDWLGSMNDKELKNYFSYD